MKLIKKEKFEIVVLDLEYITFILYVTIFGIDLNDKVCFLKIV